jgi:hypothetical protein
LLSISIPDDRDSVANSPLARSVSTLRKNKNDITYVNIPLSLFRSVHLIIKLRPMVGVPPENPYLLAKMNSKDEYRNTFPFFTKMANNCGAENPQRLSSLGLRQSTELSESHDNLHGSPSRGSAQRDQSRKRRADCSPDTSSSIDSEVFLSQLFVASNLGMFFNPRSLTRLARRSPLHRPKLSHPGPAITFTLNIPYCYHWRSPLQRKRSG